MGQHCIYHVHGITLACCEQWQIRVANNNDLSVSVMQQDDVARCVAGVRRGTVATAVAGQAYQYLTQTHNATHCRAPRRASNVYFHFKVLFSLHHIELIYATFDTSGKKVWCYCSELNHNGID